MANKSKVTSKSNLLLKIAIYLSSSALIVSFVTILVICLTRLNVSIEYKLFFLDHELKYYLPDNSLKNDYSIGQPFYYRKDANYKNQGSGWKDITDLGTLTNELKSDIYFYVPKNIGSTITADFVIESREASNVLYFNDIDTGVKLITSSRTTKYTCVLDTKSLKLDTVNKFSFVRTHVSDNIFVREIYFHE